MGEEFKAKPILMGMFDDYEEEAEKLSDSPVKNNEEEPEKKGFFGKLFGKKK